MLHARESVLQAFNVLGSALTPLAIIMSRCVKFQRGPHSPFRWCTLLLYLREYTFRLVINAVGTSGHLSIALDLLLTAHITSLERNKNRGKTSAHQPRDGTVGTYDGVALPSQSSFSWGH